MDTKPLLTFPSPKEEKVKKKKKRLFTSIPDGSVAIPKLSVAGT